MGALTRIRTAFGFGHMGNRAFGRGTALSIPTQDDATDSVDIVFSTGSGGQIGSIRTDIQRPILNSLEFTIDRAGPANGKMILSSLPSFPIPPFSIISISVSADPDPIYTGLVKIPESKGTKKKSYDFELIGFRDQMKKISAAQTFTAGTDVGQIIDTLMSADISNQTSIGYNSGKIDRNIGVSISSDIEIQKDDMIKVFDTLAALSDAEWYIDGFGDMVFINKSTSINNVFFGGYNVSEIKIQKDIDSVVNSWTITRKQSIASGGAGWSVADVATDPTSISKYGLREKRLQVPGYFATADCTTIANNLIAETSEPAISVKIKDWHINGLADLIGRGKYKVVLPLDTYDTTIQDCDDSNDWTMFAPSGMQKTTDTSIFQTGAASLKLDWPLGINNNDYLYYDNIGWQGKSFQIKFYVYANRTGSLLEFGMGDSAWDENLWDISIPVSNRFFEFTIDIESDNITTFDYVGFRVIDSTAASVVYIDDIRLQESKHQHYDLQRERVKYIFGNGKSKAEIELGQQPARSFEYIRASLDLAEQADRAGEII